MSQQCGVWSVRCVELWFSGLRDLFDFFEKNGNAKPHRQYIYFYNIRLV